MTHSYSAVSESAGWDSFGGRPLYTAAMPSAAPLPPDPRRFAIKLPRPRGIGVGRG